MLLLTTITHPAAAVPHPDHPTLHSALPAATGAASALTLLLSPAATAAVAAGIAAAAAVPLASSFFGGPRETAAALGRIASMRAEEAAMALRLGTHLTKGTSTNRAQEEEAVACVCARVVSW